MMLVERYFSAMVASAKSNMMSLIQQVIKQKHKSRCVPLRTMPGFTVIAPLRLPESASTLPQWTHNLGPIKFVSQRFLSRPPYVARSMIRSASVETRWLLQRVHPVEKDALHGAEENLAWTTRSLLSVASNSASFPAQDPNNPFRRTDHLRGAYIVLCLLRDVARLYRQVMSTAGRRIFRDVLSPFRQTAS